MPKPGSYVAVEPFQDMPHIHTSPGQHDYTVSGFIVRQSDETPKLLLHQHRKLHTYMQFGGHIELTENPWQAILRELKEEAGYLPGQLYVLQPIGMLTRLTGTNAHPFPVSYNTHPIPGDVTHYHTDACYAFVVSEEPFASRSAGESKALQLFSQSELGELDDGAIHADVREIGMFIFDVCLPTWERVSATAFDAGQQ